MVEVVYRHSSHFNGSSETSVLDVDFETEAYGKLQLFLLVAMVPV